MKLVALAVAPIAVAVAVAAGSTAAPSVTIRVVSRSPVLAGTVSSRRAGETVGILGTECGSGTGAYRLVGGTQTVGGGAWRWVGEPVSTSLSLPAYFRARWRHVRSRPVLVRIPMTPTWSHTTAPSAARVVLEVTTAQKMTGRVAELQRLNEAGSWVRVGRARFRAVGYGTYEVGFPNRPQSSTLRVYVPAKSAAPCFLPGASQSWQSPSPQTFVTIQASFGGPLGPRQLVLSGRVASGEAGQQVTVWQKGCGRIDWHDSVETPTTERGGDWRFLYPDGRLTEPSYFRADVGFNSSRTLLVRVPVHTRLRVRGRSVRLLVNTSFTGQRMLRRPVELQRKTNGGWVRVRAGRLTRIRDHAYQARFAVRQRGLTVRAFIPAGSAGPCYSATATKAVVVR